MKKPTTDLRKIGLKVTPQRLAIIKILKGNRTHPSAENIYHEILINFPGVSFATVYNTLSKLAEAGEILELDIDPNKKRFDPYTLPHNHFYCRRCGKVYDVDYDTSTAQDIKRIDGHRVDTVQINFRGMCKTCNGK